MRIRLLSSELPWATRQFSVARLLSICILLLLLLYQNPSHAQSDARALLATDTYYMITEARRGRALQNRGRKVDNPVVLATPYGNFPQQWALIPSPRIGYHYIVHRGTRKVLGIGAGSEKKTVLKSLRNRIDRQWKIQHAGRSFFRILSATSSGQYLSFKKGQKQAVLRERSDDWSQSFRFRSVARARLISSPQDEGTVVLPIHAAFISNISNERIKLRSSHHRGVPVLSAWSQKEDSVLWHFKANTSGDYRLLLELSCPRNSKNSLLEINVNGRHLEYRVPSTNSWWKNFQYFVVARRIKLRAGLNTIVIRPKKIEKKYAVNLRAPVLLRAQADRKVFIS